MSDVERTIEALLSEQRVFEPPGEFRARAVVNDPSIYEQAEADHEAFWAEQASRLSWFEPWNTVMEWNPPWVKWFLGGKLNVSYNCLDRHVESGGGDKVAFYWEGEPGERRTITYRELLDEVCRFANALKSLGVARATA
jgi:acetyl-CoA synthetase